MKYARDAENSIQTFERSVSGEDDRLSGKIFITAPCSSLATDYLVPCISQFCRKHPNIKIDVLVSDEVQDLSKGEADLALRVTSHPPEFLIGLKVCQITWDVYASKMYINNFGRPKSMKDLENHKLIGSNGSFRHVPAYKHFNELYLPENFVCNASDLLTISALSSQGMGVVILPSNYKKHKLVKLFKVNLSFDEQLCLLVHPDLRRSALIRAFHDFLYECLTKQYLRAVSIVAV
jgi:DNA-binding transcriptional LysR family regulator